MYLPGGGSDDDALKTYVDTFMSNSNYHPICVFVSASTQFMFIGYKASTNYSAFLIIGYNGFKKAIKYGGTWTITAI